MLLTNINGKFRRNILFAAFSALIIAGCASKSNDENGEEQEEQEAVSAAEPTSSPAAPPPDTAAPELAAPELAVPEAAAPDAGPRGGSVAAPSASEPMNSTRRVLYVKAGGAKVYDKAAKGAVVGKLSKGNHLLVTVEGDWARTDDGRFIPMSSLSMKGVGRLKSQANWSGGSKKSHKAAKVKKAKVIKTAAPAAAPAAAPEVAPSADEAAPE